MERLVLHWVCVCALLALPVAGCSDETAAAGGSGGSAGIGGMGGDGGAGGSGGSAGPSASVCDFALFCDAVDCDDNDRCTRDVCNRADGTCSHVATCDDFNDCTTETCDPADESCSTATPVADGTSCAGGTCQAGQCALSGSILPCTEQGIRNAIAAGDGTYTFACDGTTPVVTQANIAIDKDVILDGEGKLTIDGNCDHQMLSVSGLVTAELHNLVLQRGFKRAITNSGMLNLERVVVSGNRCVSKSCVGNGPIHNSSLGSLTLTDSTVFDNEGAGEAGAINSDGILTLVRSTVSNNRATAQVLSTGDTVIIDSTILGAVFWGAVFLGSATVLNSTVHDLTVGDGSVIRNSTIVGLSNDIAGSALEGPSNSTDPLTIVGSLVVGDCSGDIVSNGYNIESPGNTCGFDQGTDQVDVTEGDLNLGPLADNGGPTMTHALGEGSVAIDVIPADMCEVDEDQRGEPRLGGAMCDVGAFEVQEGSL